MLAVQASSGLNLSGSAFILVYSACILQQQQDNDIDSIQSPLYRTTTSVSASPCPPRRYHVIHSHSQQQLQRWVSAGQCAACNHGDDPAVAARDAHRRPASHTRGCGSAACVVLSDFAASDAAEECVKSVRQQLPCPVCSFSSATAPVAVRGHQRGGAAGRALLC